MMTADIFALSIATVGGAAVGVERQWSEYADGPRARFAGIRTFTMFGARSLGGCEPARETFLPKRAFDAEFFARAAD
jgi:hypothetical protein